jgi:glycosyltransferase involved in cell wall biosynthesis
VPERFLDVLLPTFLGAGQGGLGALLSSWGEPDLVHAHFVFPGGWVGRHLALQLARPLILTEHSSRLEDQTATVLRRRLAGEVYRSAARVIAVSPFQAQQIRAIEPTTDVTVIGNPVDTAFFSPEKQPELRRPGSRFHFLSIAHLKPRKGLDVLLGAARILVDRGRCDFDITIGGEGPERTRLEAEVARLGLGDRVRFAGQLMPIEVRDAMRGCDAFVLASRRESFGLVLAEAISCGRPVVTTRSGGAEFVVTEESGILVAVDDPTALAEAMDNLISRRIHFDSDSLHREAVRRFSRETYRQSLRRVYLEALP